MSTNDHLQAEIAKLQAKIHSGKMSSRRAEVELFKLALAEGYRQRTAEEDAQKQALVEALEAAARHLGGHSGAPNDPVTGIEIEQRLNTAGMIRNLLADLAAAKEAPNA